MRREEIERNIEAQMEALKVKQFMLAIYENMEERMQWDAMDVVYDDNGERVLDSEGNTTFKQPDEESYHYIAYKAYQEVLKAIEKLMK